MASQGREMQDEVIYDVRQSRPLKGVIFSQIQVGVYYDKCIAIIIPS